jgi:protein-tyrosine phosphatase
VPPFTVLHVCMGNICRSPMAERLLAKAVRDRIARAAHERVVADIVEEALLHNHSAGTGGWHAGEEMNPPAAREVSARGGDPHRFAARRLRMEHLDSADLILTSTADQQEYVVALRPDAASRTFVLGQFGRLLAGVDRSALPAADLTPEAVYARGTALVEAIDALRNGTLPLPDDDLDDPWGRGDQTFSRVADEIEDTVVPLAGLLLP